MPDQVDSTSNSPAAVGDSTGNNNGWYRENEETSNSNPNGNGLSLTTRSKPKTTKTCILALKYYANGGDGDPPSSTTQTYNGKLEPVRLEEAVKDNENFMEKEGYWFYGWATTSDGSAQWYPGNLITKEWSASGYGTTRYKLYAKWRSSKLWIFMPDDYTIEKNYKAVMQESGASSLVPGPIFTRTGYTIVGWSSEKGGEKVYDLQQPVQSSSNNISIFYPVWEANTYTITFHANGGVGEDVVVSVLYDEDITIPETTFTKTGYHQNGWNEEEDGSNASWYTGWTYTFKRTDNVDLYVVWAGNEYTVHYSEEAPGSTNYVHSSIAVYGSPFYTDRVPYPSGREYYSFDGWVADDNTILTKQDAWFDAYSYGQNPIWTLQRDVVLYRRWSPIYPLGRIYFGTKYSDEYSIYVEEPPECTWPSYSYTHHQAFGKHGDILIDSKRFNNVDRVYKISAYDFSDYQSVAKKVSEWLHKNRSGKYIRLEDSYDQDVYRLAVYEESQTLENVLSKAGRCEIKFNCKPQKFLLSGDKRIDILTSGQTIHNPTDFVAKPLITFYGVGNIYVNDSQIIVRRCTNHVTFDAESYLAYDVAGRIMNYYIYAEDEIILEPGDNTISWDGSIFGVSVVPRWWIV